MARPREFDLDKALAAARRVFLLHGFDGASLENLTEAMGINKPSLYGAIGDKKALYATVLEAYAAMAKSFMGETLNAGNSLESAVRDLLLGAVEVYAPAKGAHLGCLIATTATTAAGADSSVRSALSGFLAQVDRLMVERLSARFGEELTEETVLSIAEVLSATMYSLAIRARAGTSRKHLQAIADRAVNSVAAIAKVGAHPVR